MASTRIKTAAAASAIAIVLTFGGVGAAAAAPAAAIEHPAMAGIGSKYCKHFPEMPIFGWISFWVCQA